jgi:hypothetical protein
VKTCKVEGCDQYGQTRRGMCGMHYTRWRLTGTTDRDPQYAPPPERLAAGLVRMPNGCLEWTKCTLKGYGQMHVDGVTTLTHRLAWTLANGPIPDGLCVLHHCDNPPCCETAPSEEYPEGHLFLGTKADNMLDMAAKGRAGWRPGSDVTHCPQGHEYAGDNVILERGSRICRECRRAKSRRRHAKERAMRAQTVSTT